MYYKIPEDYIFSKGKVIYKNPFEEYVQKDGLCEKYLQDGEIRSEFLQYLHEACVKLLDKLLDMIHHPFGVDISVCTGETGIGMLLFLFGNILNSEEFMLEALWRTQIALYSINFNNYGFHKGDCGPLALLACIFHRFGNKNRAKIYTDYLKVMAPEVIAKDQDSISDGFKKGRAGYLFALLFVNHYMGPKTIPSDVIRNVVESIFNSGQKQANLKEFTEAPLLYEEDGKYLFNIPTGLIGILHVLLQANKYIAPKERKTLLKPTIDYVLRKRSKSGNLPKYHGDKDDGLVQWCHGATGAVHLFCLAYKVFDKQVYLDAAKDCGEIVWKRGLLRKGFCLCHGVAGNTYAFLELYQTTKDSVYLHRACAFAEWCSRFQMHDTMISDTPPSLYEGMAGVLYMLLDIQKPNNAAFPAFSLHPLSEDYDKPIPQTGLIHTLKSWTPEDYYRHLQTKWRNKGEVTDLQAILLKEIRKKFKTEEFFE